MYCFIVYMLSQLVKLHLYSVFYTQIQSIADKGVSDRNLIQERNLLFKVCQIFQT